ncbi:MAG: DNA topoisomerase 4 subunit A, partial [Chloroflexi bacterium]|nr:DNA topoisomerase 4 subunit A [Chloroflexota bacterium]
MEVGLVERVDIEEKMRSAYLSYAMSVITARALPDVRDGLKPVQRRILYAMYDMGLRHNQPTRKSARIVGEVLGKYHPHGESAVYEAMVRMAQDFTMRYVLVEGQGNFGSVDGDSAAAIRYTEARLSRLGEEMLADLDKDTVNFTDNFDGSLKEPTVLPAKLPNLLVNGVGGIAVGMATNIPPHNLGEVAEAIAYLVDRYHQAEDVTLDDLMRFIRGPDFPTGGTILGTEGIRQAYATGKGRIIMRAQAHVEEIGGGRMAIIVTELPYQVNKAALVERIALLAREGRLEGIADLRDESDRVGMRIVIELKRGVEPAPVLGGLLKYTQMQATFGVNMLALVDGEPRTLSLKRILLHYIEHRAQVVERRARFDLERALARSHILEGLLLALDHLDEVIRIIRRSRTAETAQRNLRARFKFTEVQAQAILDTQLRRLAALERHKLEEEYRELQARILALQDLLAHRDKVLAVVKEEVLTLKEAYGDARRTRIVEGEASADLAVHDLTPDEETWVLLTMNGAVRRTSSFDPLMAPVAGAVSACEPLQSA